MASKASLLRKFLAAKIPSLLPPPIISPPALWFHLFQKNFQDNFGYGESVLSMVFALNGVAVGALQLLGMRHLVGLLGKHMMLITGNVFLAAGMMGVALSRNPVIHFAVRG